MTTRRSPLELLHPDGSARSALVIGDAVPAELRPEAREADVVDLAIVTPASVREGARRLSDDGVLVVAGAADPEGLAVRTTLVQLHGGSRQLLVPRERLREALESIVPAAGWKGRAARAAAQVGLTPVRSGLTVAQRPGARPLCAWLDDFGVRPAPPVVSYSDRGSLVVHPRGGREIVKLGRIVEEADALRELGPAARAAGARVPEPLRTGDLAGLPLLVESMVPGRPVSFRLRPRDLAAYLELVGAWLVRWNEATAAARPLGRRHLERALLEPLADLALSESYGRHVERLCARLEGREVPLVAAHHDLTTANVLVGQGLGVVDWATAEGAALPLTDLLYAVADARAAADRFADRAESFAATFAADGTPAPDVAHLHARLVRTLRLEPDVVELCFHACWLRHAANEARRGDSPRPFGEIATRVAAAT